MTLLVGGELGELPRQQVRVEAERVQVGFGLQQVGQPRAPGECADGLSALPQRPRRGSRSPGRPRIRRCRAGAGPGRRRPARTASAAAAPDRTGGQPAAAQVLLQRLAGMLVLPVPAQRQVEGGQRAAELGEREPDGQDDLLEVGAGGAGEVDAHRQDLSAEGGRVPLRSFHPELPGQGSCVGHGRGARAGGRGDRRGVIVRQRWTSVFARTRRARRRVVACRAFMRTLVRMRQFFRSAKPCSSARVRG